MRALELHQQGWNQRDIAAALGATEGAVSQWLAAARRGGPEALASHTDRRGVAPKLTPEQVRLIPDFLWHGAEAYGFRGDVWTCDRVAGVIREEFGVSYSKSQVSRLLKHLGWTPQVPITRAIQRDEEAIARWRVESWPALKEKARRERRKLVFVDESGFYLLPGVVKTYGPRGRTPVVDEWQTRDHLSVMGGVTPRGQGLHAGAAEVVERAAHDRVPHPPGPPGRGSAAGDLGRVADPPAGRGQRVRGRGAGEDPRGAAAGVRPGPEPGGMAVAAPEGGRVGQPVVPGPGSVAPGTSSGPRSRATEAAPRTVVLRGGRIGA